MRAYDQYRIQCDATTSSGLSTNVSLAIVELSETFSGTDEAIGATVVGAGVTAGDPQNVVDGSALTSVEMFSQSGGNVSLTLTLSAAKAIREWRMLEKAGNPLNVDLQAFDGSAWVTLDRRENELFEPGVIQAFKIYESAGNAQFEGGEIATEVALHRVDDGELAGIAELDGVTGDYYLLTPDRGPFQPMITRTGHRPLMGDKELASEA